VVGGHFVVFSVVENVISINCPPSSNPLVNALILDTFLGQLVLNIVLGRLLEVGLLTVNLIFNVMVATSVMVNCTKGTSTHHSSSFTRSQKHVEHHFN
jgi:hypothetical protein